MIFISGIIISLGFVFLNSNEPINLGFNMQVNTTNINWNYQIGLGMLVSGMIILFQSIVEIYVYSDKQNM